MFHLTRRERLLVAGLLIAFITGLAVKHFRERIEAGTPFSTVSRDAKH